MSLRAVIYDLDGTLVDSRADLCDSVNATLLALGYPALGWPSVLAFVGEGAERLVRRSLVAAGGDEARLAEAMELWSAAYGDRLLAKTRPYPGVIDLLHEPPALRAVLTNKPGAFARAICAGLGLSPFLACVVGGDDAPKKPDPRGLLSLCAALDVGSGEALLVGDSLVDVECAKAAGVPMCAVTWGLGLSRDLRDAAPAFVCSSAGELGALLLRLRA